MQLQDFHSDLPAIVAARHRDDVLRTTAGELKNVLRGRARSLRSVGSHAARPPRLAGFIRIVPVPLLPLGIVARVTLLARALLVVARAPLPARALRIFARAPLPARGPCTSPVSHPPPPEHRSFRVGLA
jgi:hypothetical protein